MRILVLTLLLLAALISPGCAQKRVVCYFSSWAVYRSGNGRFGVENIDPKLCTHAIYAFIGLNDNATVKINDPWNDVTKGGFAKFNNLRKINTNLKTLVAIGGWNEGSTKFSSICNSATLRAKFVTNLFNFVTQYGFNGLDLDWEYPATREGIAADKANFVSLIKELRAKFTPAGLLLTAAVSASLTSGTVSYDIPQLSANLDFINLMTYDFHGAGDGRTGFNAPLTESNATVSYWLNQKVDKNKLVLGVPLYGHTFTLKTASTAEYAEATLDGVVPGPWSKEPGSILYNEVCTMQKMKGWKEVWNTAKNVPYIFKGNQWISFDNVKSVQAKGCLAKSRSLGGVMVYALEMDDFNNLCGGGKYPLLKALRTAYRV